MNDDSSSPELQKVRKHVGTVGADESRADAIQRHIDFLDECARENERNRRLLLTALPIAFGSMSFGPAPSNFAPWEVAQRQKKFTNRGRGHRR